MDRIDVWCPGEKRVVGTLPGDIGLVTRTTFWTGFRPATSEYRLPLPEPDGTLAYCTRCRTALAVFASDINVAMSAAERQEVAERRAMGRAQYGDGQAVPTRAQLREEIARTPAAAGAIVRHFMADEYSGDELLVHIVLGSTRIA